MLKQINTLSPISKNVKVKNMDFSKIFRINANDYPPKKRRIRTKRPKKSKITGQNIESNKSTKPAFESTVRIFEGSSDVISIPISKDIPFEFLLDNEEPISPITEVLKESTENMIWTLSDMCLLELSSSSTENSDDLLNYSD
ncbi:hypothetical protein PCE1_000109 [Barthelona sp. PCE]